MEHMAIRHNALQPPKLQALLNPVSREMPTQRRQEPMSLSIHGEISQGSPDIAVRRNNVYNVYNVCSHTSGPRYARATTLPFRSVAPSAVMGLFIYEKQQLPREQLPWQLGSSPNGSFRESKSVQVVWASSRKPQERRKQSDVELLMRKGRRKQSSSGSNPEPPQQALDSRNLPISTDSAAQGTPKDNKTPYNKTRSTPAQGTPNDKTPYNTTRNTPGSSRNPAQPEASRAAPDSAGAAASAPSETPPQGGLPAPRVEVLKACSLTGAALVGAGVAIRELSALAASSGLPVNDCVSSVPFSLSLSPTDIGLTSLAVLGVTLGRLALLQTSPSFAAASTNSNTQVLTNLSVLDILAVSAISGVSEEVLFRTALLPLLGMNPVGVLVSGAVFGSLHLSGGRNYVFAAWAAGVGILYGCLLVSTLNPLCPLAAHSLANVTAAAIWKSQQNNEQ